MEDITARSNASTPSIDGVQLPQSPSVIVQPPVSSWQTTSALGSNVVLAQLQPTTTTEQGENPEKSYVKTMVLATLFGYFGVDRFYLGKVGTGIAKLLTLGGLGVWVLVDFIIALVGAARQKGNDLPLLDTKRYKPFFVRIVVILLIVYAAIFILEFVLVFAAIPKLEQESRDAQNRVDQLRQQEQPQSDLNYQTN